jgi:hypothetical protein
MSEEPTMRSAEEIHSDLISEAEQKLKEAERELVELERRYREVKMVEFAGRGQADGIFSDDEKHFLEELSQSREDVKRKKQFWQTRLISLQNYDVQSFEESYRYDTRKLKY